MLIVELKILGTLFVLDGLALLLLVGFLLSRRKELSQWGHYLLKLGTIVNVLLLLFRFYDAGRLPFFSHYETLLVFCGMVKAGHLWTRRRWTGGEWLGVFPIGASAAALSGFLFAPSTNPDPRAWPLLAVSGAFPWMAGSLAIGLAALWLALQLQVGAWIGRRAAEKHPVLGISPLLGKAMEKARWPMLHLGFLGLSAGLAATFFLGLPEVGPLSAGRDALEPVAFLWLCTAGYLHLSAAPEEARTPVASALAIVQILVILALLVALSASGAVLLEIA